MAAWESAPVVERPTRPRGNFPIDRNRPAIKNDDGSFSTEQTITIGSDGRYFNIPTIVEGRQLSEEEAVRQFRSGRNQPVGEFATLDEATSAARQRSDHIGIERGSERRSAWEAAPVVQPPQRQQAAGDPARMSSGRQLGFGAAQIPTEGAPQAPVPTWQLAPQRETSIVEKIVGGVEAALTTVTGLVGGVVGPVAGVVTDIASPGLGRPENAQRAERTAEGVMQAMTYQPRTDAGQQYAEQIGEAMQGVEAIAPAMPQVTGMQAALGPATRAAGDAGRAGAAQARGGISRALETLTPIRPAPSRQAAGGSAGAAGADVPTMRRERAADLPVPIQLTKGQAERTFEQQRFERETAKDPEVGAPLRERFADQNERLIKNLDAFVELTGAESPDAYTAGSRVVGALSEKAAAAKAKIDEAYAKARDAGDMAEPIDAAPLARWLEENRSSAGNAGVIGTAEAELIRLGGAQKGPDGVLVPREITINDLEELRKKIVVGGKKDPTNAHFADELNRVIDAATDGKGGDLYKEARRLYADYAKEFKARAVVADMLSAKKKGSEDRKVPLEAVHRRAVHSSSLDDLKFIKRSLLDAGESGRQAWRELQGRVLSDLRDEATQNTARDVRGNPIVSADKLDKAIAALERDGKLELLFGKHGAEKLRDVNDLVKDIYTAPPGAVNTSNTASVLAKWFSDSAAGAWMTGIPLPILNLGKAARDAIRTRKARKQVREALGPDDDALQSRRADPNARPFEPPDETQAPTTETPAVKTETDPRLREIDRLREGASPETLKALDERAQQIRRELRQQELRATRDAEAKQLEATATKTQDPELRASLIERANKLRAERIPVPEAKEVAEPAPTGRAPDLPKLPTPDVEPPPTGKAPDLPRLPVPVVREGGTAPTRARADATIPAPEAKELTTAEAAAMRPTARERELVGLFERATDPEVRKDLQRLIEAERKAAEQRRRGEEYARLAREATDPELRASLQAKARKLGVDPDKEPEAPAARPEEPIPTGEAIELDYDQVLYSRSPMKSVEANVARGREAMNKALTENNTVHRAMHRTGLGWVDFVWGDDQKGIQHILKQRQEKDGLTREQAMRMLTQELVPTIAEGAEARRVEVNGSVMLHLDRGDTRAILVRNPGSNAWMLTGFEKRSPGERRGGFDPAPSTQTAPTPTRHGLGAGDSRIVPGPDDARGPLPERPFGSPQALESSLRAKFGAKLIDGLVKRGVLHLGDGAPADVPRDALGRFTGKRAELFFDRLDPETAPAALMHEVGEHYGLPRMMGEKRYAELLADLRKLRDQKEVAAAWEKVKRDYVNEDGTPSIPEGSDTFMREVAAQLVESAPNRPIVKRIVEAVRAWVYREFGVNLGKVDAGLLRGLATAALRKAARGELDEPAGGNTTPRVPAAAVVRAEAPAEPPAQSAPNPVKKPEVATVADLLETPEVSSKLEPVAAAGLTADDATEFLRALHAPERNRIVAIRNPRAGSAGSGMSNDEARRILARFTPAQRRVLDDLARAAHREAVTMLDAMVEAGALDKRTRDFIRTNYRFYVPISSAKDAAAGRPIPATEAA